MMVTIMVVVIVIIVTLIQVVTTVIMICNTSLLTNSLKATRVVIVRTLIITKMKAMSKK